ncbi:MAG: acetolactate synthase small subunit [Clostridiales bacterium]|nr:acetolactate synthase small subunit [Clostridiales bacterium]
MTKIFSILVENKAGALSRISGLFARRGFNINSLSVGETDDPTVSRMTISSDGDKNIMEQIEKQLNKLIDVIKVQSMEPMESIRKEFIMIKLYCQQSTRSEILDICHILNVKIVDITHTTLTIETGDTPENIDLLLSLVSPFGIVEMARTGLVALQKGSESIKNKK